eukprot:scaffold8208_cov142-Cylindrotheca_fusiformis.AAC.1
MLRVLFCLQPQALEEKTKRKTWHKLLVLTQVYKSVVDKARLIDPLITSSSCKVGVSSSEATFVVVYGI